MIVRHFLQWVRTAPAAERADATAALARAYLYSELSPDDRLAAEGAMVMSLDDPSPLVRRAMAEVLAGAPEAPAPLMLALASDQPDIAHLVLERSPLLLDADLVELVATGDDAAQGQSHGAPACRNPSRPRLPKSALPRRAGSSLQTGPRRLPHFRSAGSGSVMGNCRMSARPCWPGTICPRRCAKH
jgi:hypothetical protein